MARRTPRLWDLPRLWVSALVEVHQARDFARMMRSIGRDDDREARLVEEAERHRDELAERIRAALRPECPERDRAGLDRVTFAHLVEQELGRCYPRARQRRPVLDAIFAMQHEALAAMEDGDA